MAKTIRDIRSLAHQTTAKAVRTLAGIMNEPRASDAARVRAAIALLDRGWGKPRRSLDLTMTQKKPAEMTDEELMLSQGVETLPDCWSVPGPRYKSGKKGHNMRRRRLKNRINRGPREYKRFDDAFGLCPICHKTDGSASAGKAHFYYCKEHRKSWCVGYNLFSGWRDRTEEEQRRIWNEIGLDDFEDVEPYFHPRFFPREDDADKVIPFSAEEPPF